MASPIARRARQVSVDGEAETRLSLEVYLLHPNWATGMFGLFEGYTFTVQIARAVFVLRLHALVQRGLPQPDAPAGKTIAQRRGRLQGLCSRCSASVLTVDIQISFIFSMRAPEPSPSYAKEQILADLIAIWRTWFF